MTGRYDIMCNWGGCTVIFQTDNKHALYCKDHRKPAKLAAMKKRLEKLKQAERVCETEGCNNTFTGDPRRRFCHECAYSKAHSKRDPAKKRGKPRRRYNQPMKPVRFDRQPITKNSLGRMTIPQLLKIWEKWRAGKVDFTR